MADVGGEPAAGAVDWAELLHSYGLRRAQQLPAVALEYSKQAVRARKGDLPYSATLLRELLVQSQAFGFFVSSGQGGDAHTHPPPPPPPRPPSLSIDIALKKQSHGLRSGCTNHGTLSLCWSRN